jgi:hypothetical protein
MTDQPNTVNIYVAKEKKNNVIKMVRLPRLMECGNCNGDNFAISEEGAVCCRMCGGMINAMVVFNELPTSTKKRLDEAREFEESCQKA